MWFFCFFLVEVVLNRRLKQLKSRSMVDKEPILKLALPSNFLVCFLSNIVFSMIIYLSIVTTRVAGIFYLFYSDKTSCMYIVSFYSGSMRCRYILSFYSDNRTYKRFYSDNMCCTYIFSFCSGNTFVSIFPSNGRHILSFYLYSHSPGLVSIIITL